MESKLKFTSLTNYMNVIASKIIFLSHHQPLKWPIFFQLLSKDLVKNLHHELVVLASDKNYNTHIYSIQEEGKCTWACHRLTLGISSPTISYVANCMLEICISVHFCKQQACLKRNIVTIFYLSCLMHEYWNNIK